MGRVTKKTNTGMNAKSGATKRGDDTVFNQSDIDLVMFEQEHHAQILNENYYQYSGTAEVPVAGSGKAYTFIRNNTGKDIILYPVKIFITNNLPSKTITLKVTRSKGAAVNEANGTVLQVVNLGKVQETVPEAEKPVLLGINAVDITNFGTVMNPLTTYQYGANALSEEERGERYVLRDGETLLGTVENLADDVNIWTIPAYSFVDPLADL